MNKYPNPLSVSLSLSLSLYIYIYTRICIYIHVKWVSMLSHNLVNVDNLGACVYIKKQL